MKDCPTGSLTKQQFQSIYKSYFPFGDSQKYSHYVFTHLNSNKNQVVSFEEFIVAVDVMAKGSFEEKCMWSFQLFDLDEDGFISPPEMLAVVDSIYRMIGSVDLPPDESTATLRVEKVFKTMDLDQDGLLSKQVHVLCDVGVYRWRQDRSSDSQVFGSLYWPCIEINRLSLCFWV